jgi:LPS sulfotransferase NodH
MAVGCESYFVCATPRTGSSLLLGLLESTGVAGHPEAYFRAPDEVSWARQWRITMTSDGAVDYPEFVRAARAVGSTPNGVFGAKVMWGTLDEVVAKLAVGFPDLAGDDLALLDRAFGSLRFVFLRREDVLAQAVSWLRAEQTGTWYIGADGWAPAFDRVPVFDRDEISSLMRLIGEHNAGWERWFASVGVRPHRLRYEQLDADPVAVARGVLEFLGLDLPAGRPLVARHQHQADELNREWMYRYRAGSTVPRHLK